MKSEERPIVFTITRSKATISIFTKDGRAEHRFTVVHGVEFLMFALTSLSKEFNDKGYAVLFEVD